MENNDKAILKRILMVFDEESIDDLIVYFSGLNEYELPPTFLLMFMGALTKVKGGIFSGAYEDETYTKAYNLLLRSEFLWERKLVLNVNEVDDEIVEALNHLICCDFLTPSYRINFIRLFSTLKIKLDISEAKELVLCLLMNIDMPHHLENTFAYLCETVSNRLDKPNIYDIRNYVLILSLYKIVL